MRKFICRKPHVAAAVSIPVAVLTMAALNYVNELMRPITEERSSPGTAILFVWTVAAVLAPALRVALASWKGGLPRLVLPIHCLVAFAFLTAFTLFIRYEYPDGGNSTAPHPPAVQGSRMASALA